VEVVVLKNQIPNVKVPLQLHPSPCIPKFISMDVGLGFAFEGFEDIATGQVVCKDLMTTKTKAPNSKHT
jgi:hypothetical protein